MTSLSRDHKHLWDSQSNLRVSQLLDSGQNLKFRRMNSCKCFIYSCAVICWRGHMAVTEQSCKQAPQASAGPKGHMLIFMLTSHRLSGFTCKLRPVYRRADTRIRRMCFLFKATFFISQFDDNTLLTNIIVQQEHEKLR